MLPRKILVCGGCGFMGSNFIHYTMKKYPRVGIINLDALTYAGNLKNLDGISGRNKYNFVKGNICDTILLGRLMKKVDAVVNFAAETHVDRSINSSDVFIRSNVFGAQSLINALGKASNIRIALHVSTDEVWGDLPLRSRKKFNENSPFRPNSPYAASKAAGDLLIRAAVKTYKLPLIVSHSVNNFGPRQYPEKIIPHFICLAMRNMPLTLYGNGKNMRDWLHVDDHSAAIWTLLLKGSLGEEYGISFGKEHTNFDIASRILHALKKSPDLITYVADRPGHDLKYSVDSSKLRGLGWAPRHSLEKDLATTILWYKKHKVYFDDT